MSESRSLPRAEPTASATDRSATLAKLRIQRAETPTPNGRRRGLFRAFAVLLLLLCGGVAGLLLAVRQGWIASSASWLALPEALQARPEVRLATVSVETGRSADAAVVATGYLESRRQAKIGARAPGRIQIIHVEEGSLVEAGQVLAILEHADMDASLAATQAMHARAKAELAEQEVTIQLAKREFDRAEELRGSGGVSMSEYDTAKFGYEGAIARRASLQAAAELAAARVREAEQMKENMFIRAPFRGTVISKDAEVGESILPGGMGEASGRGSVVTVADLEHLEVDCDVKEDYISRVRPGGSVEVAVDAVPGRRYQGRVRKIIPMGDRARATIKVKAEIIDVDDRLFPEMSATVYFLPEPAAKTAEAHSAEASRRRVFCEREAVLTDPSGSYVWQLDGEQRLRRLPVQTGATRDNRVEITSGLSGGEQVVIAPPGVKAGQLARLPL